MPSLSDQMQEGTIIKWLIDDEGPVGLGDELVEIETDKATMTVSAEIAGVLHIVEPEGATVAVGEVIARVSGEPTAAKTAATAAASPATDEPPAAATPTPTSPPAAATPTPTSPPAAATPTPTSPPAAATPTPTEPTGAGSSTNANISARRMVASTPLARRVARAHGIALDSVAGTGPSGRVTRHDVLRAARIEPEPPLGAPPMSAAASASRPRQAPEGAQLRPFTALQRTIARRMSEQALVPVFQVQTDVEMDAAVALRAQLKRLPGQDPAPSVNDLIIRACALALRDHPLVNGAYRKDGFLLNDDVNVGMAVASDAGLLVATIPRTDRKTLGQIAAEARVLAGRVRDGIATPAELSGSTFTVSNLGMLGMTGITAVINPPQAAILGVGALRAVLARGANGNIVDREIVTLNLSCDHRILNGTDGAAFLSQVQRLLQHPLALLR